MHSFILGLLTLLLMGCDGSQSNIEHDFADYIQRVANVQGADMVPLPMEQTQRLPDKRDIQIPLEPLTIGLLDSYELRKCDLFSLIAQRNSVLGKVQDQFRAFDYQVALLQGLERCRNEAGLSAKLRQQLTAIIIVKQHELPAHWYNLLYTSDAMRSQLSSHQWLQANAEREPVHEALSALHIINNAIRQQQWHHTLPAITPYQEVLEKQVLLGHLKFSLDNLTHWLSAATNQLQRHDAQILCGANRDQTKLNYLRNVFQSSYADKLQPYLADMDSLYLQIEPNLDLFRPLEQGEYAFDIQRSHQAFRLAIKHHQQYWQALFDRCAIKVGTQ